MIMPTTSITANVTIYCRLVTANEYRGGTKKKSNAATPTTVATIDGPLPNRMATSTTVSKNSMTILAKSK